MFLTDGRRIFAVKTREALSSVLPVTAIVFLLSISVSPLSPGTLTLFLFGAIMLIAGMGLFTTGVDMSMIPLGEGVGIELSRSKKLIFALVAIFALGLFITIAEPDLQILADQVPGIPRTTLIMSIGVGVGCFLLIAMLRIRLRVPLPYVFIFFYTLIVIIAGFVDANIIPVSFDSGGVTTGPVTVPFILALGVGMASVRTEKGSIDDSFGLIGTASVGPIITVLLLGVAYNIADASYVSPVLLDVTTTRGAAHEFARAFPQYIREVGIALVPLLAVFVLFQLATRRFHRHQSARIISGFVYSGIGLALFLTGVNVGFLPAGHNIGLVVGEGSWEYMLIPIGMLIGYYMVAAEPAVQVLNKQVEEVSNGAISQKAMQRSLSIGVSISVGLSMLRIMTGVSILWFIIPGYLIALAMTFYVPHIFTGVAFDSGGAASGPITATFLLPFAIGACEGVGGNVLTDAFGAVAMVAMTPIVTVQAMGIISRRRQEARIRRVKVQLGEVEDGIVYYDTA